MDYKIEDNVPLSRVNRSWSKFAFVLEMRPGQSFLLERKDRSALVAFAINNNINYACRTMSDGKIRFWVLKKEEE